MTSAGFGHVARDKTKHVGHWLNGVASVLLLSTREFYEKILLVPEEKSTGGYLSESCGHCQDAHVLYTKRNHRGVNLIVMTGNDCCRNEE